LWWSKEGDEKRDYPHKTGKKEVGEETRITRHSLAQGSKSEGIKCGGKKVTRKRKKYGHSKEISRAGEGTNLTTSVK